MSRKCYICGKVPNFGENVSHSNRHTKRRWLPNLQKISILVANKRSKQYVCTKCMKAGKIQKAV
jgi:large subunit ribosomal protein L28